MTRHVQPAALARLRQDRLSLDGSDPSSSEAFERAKLSVRSALHGDAGGSVHVVCGPDIAWYGLAALAIGEVEDGVRALDHMAGLGDARPIHSALELWLLSCFAAWTGDVTEVRHRLARGRHALADLEAAHAGDTALFIAPALRALAYAADCAGDARLATHCSTRAANSPDPTALGSLLLSRHEAGVASAAHRVLTTVHDLLGIEPDAPRQRVRLQPRIPDAWTAMTVRNIAPGDARLTLRYTRADSHIRFAIEQTAGAMPLRIVFEPVLPAGITRVHLDGRPVDLELRAAGGRQLAALQLEAAEERIVEFRLDGLDR